MAEGEDKIIGARVPENLVGKRLYDAYGNCWVIEETETRGWVGKNTKLEAKLATGHADLAVLIKKIAKEVIRNWLDREAIPYVKYNSLNGSEFLEKCILDGERRFRKEFVEKLGASSAAMWRNILKSQAKAIVRNVVAKNPLKDHMIGNNIVSSGLMPPGGRLKWSGAANGITYTLYCIECPPCARSINIFGRYRRLAFPYVYIMPLFANERLYQFFAFYGREEITSDKAELYFPNLPHIYDFWPYAWCAAPREELNLTKPNWHKIVQGIFWDSSFTYNRRGEVCVHWLEASERIPEVKSVDVWEKLSRDEPEKIISLPWKETGYTIGSFAEKLLKGYCDKDAPIDDQTREKIFYDKVESFLSAFESQLQEELHFLGSTFFVQPSIRTTAENFAKDSMNKAGEVLSSSLETRCGDIVKSVLQELEEEPRIP